MLNFFFKTKPSDLGKFPKRLAQRLRMDRAAALRVAGKKILTFMRMQASPVLYKGAYRKGFYATVVFDRLDVGNRAPNAVFVEMGRRAGAARPPIAPIREWAVFHGMAPGVAFPIARNISIRGIAARKVFTLPRNREWMRKVVKDALVESHEKSMRAAAGVG